MNQGILVFQPDDAQIRPEMHQVTQLLSHIGLIGSGIENLQNSYLAGEKFLQLITFMGCSPHIRFEPEDDRDKGYCYISLSSSNNPRLRASEHARPPRCHACRKPLGGEWQTAVTHEAAITCLHCGQQQYADQLGWRNDAGLGRFFIEIHNIFPGEAQPVPQLQQQLQGIAGSPWRYFYLHKA